MTKRRNMHRLAATLFAKQRRQEQKQYGHPADRQPKIRKHAGKKRAVRFVAR